MANINIPFNCDYESINITVKCPIEGSDKEEQIIIAQLKKDKEEWIFCTPGSIVSKNVHILTKDGSYEVIDSNGNFKGKIVGDILSTDGTVILSVSDNKIEVNDLVVSNDTVLNNVVVNGTFTIKNGTEILHGGESSVPKNNSLIVLDTLKGDNVGVAVKNTLGTEFLGFSKENNMFEIKTNASLVDDKVSGGEFGDLKARTIFAEDIMLGNKDKGEQVINLHDVITADDKGTAKITTNSLTTVHHSSVFHTAISYDSGFANTEDDLLNSLKGGIYDTYLGEKIGGTKDGHVITNPDKNNYLITELRNLTKSKRHSVPVDERENWDAIHAAHTGETYNQHWLTINETAKNPKFKWWVATDGDYSAGTDKKVEYTDVLTAQASGIEVKGGIKIYSDDLSKSVDLNYNTFGDLTSTKNDIAANAGDIMMLEEKLLGVANKADLDEKLDSIKELADKFEDFAESNKEYVDFDGNLEVMEDLKAGSINTSELTVNGIDLMALITSMSAEITQLKARILTLEQ